MDPAAAESAKAHPDVGADRSLHQHKRADKADHDGEDGAEEADEHLRAELEDLTDVAAEQHREDHRVGEVVFQRNKSRYGITVPVQGVCYIDRNVTDNGFLRDLLELLRRHDCNKEQILAVFKKYSDQIRVQDVTDNDFDYAVWFENDANNIYRYCFHEEEGHVIYHRFTPREYQALMPLEM